MSGHTKWSEIRKLRPRTPEQEAAIQEGVREMLRESMLWRLREHQQVTQQELATALGETQEDGSSERADEPHLSTVRRFVETMGGELIVQVRLDGETFDLLGSSAVSHEQPAMDNGQRATIPADG